MKLGGLDIATTTGAAVLDSDTRSVSTRTFKYAGAKKKSILDVEDAPALDPVELGKVFAWFEPTIRIWLIEEKIEAVAIEEPLRTDFQPKKKRSVNPSAVWAGQGVKIEIQKGGGTNLKTVFKLHGLEAIAVKVCTQLNIPVRFVNQGTWRKDFLGNGRPTDAKAEAVKMCRRMGIEIGSIDAAESVGIAHWLRNQLFPYSPAANSLFNLPPTTRVTA